MKDMIACNNAYNLRYDDYNKNVNDNRVVIIVFVNNDTGQTNVAVVSSTVGQQGDGFLVTVDLFQYDIPIEPTHKYTKPTYFNSNIISRKSVDVECQTDDVKIIYDSIDLRIKFAQNLPGRLKFTAKKICSNLILSNSASQLAHRFPESIVAASLPFAVKAGNSILCIGLEGFHMGYDLHKNYQKTKTGQTTFKKFKKYAALRVTRGCMGFFGGFCGSFIGQVIIPIPIFGAAVGGFLGSMVGSAIGHAEGLVLGEALVAIDLEKVSKCCIY